MWWKSAPWVLIVALVGAVWVLSGDIRSLRNDVSAAQAALTAERRLSAELRRIGAAQAQIEGELQNGGQDSLSDYMSGAAGKLWP